MLQRWVASRERFSIKWHWFLEPVKTGKKKSSSKTATKLTEYSIFHFSSFGKIMHPKKIKMVQIRLICI
jgi:hypothetical protein